MDVARANDRKKALSFARRGRRRLAAAIQPDRYAESAAVCGRLGDLAANTIVVRNPRLAEPDLDQLFAGKYNSLRQYPHLAARLRQRISPAEASVALQALFRRDEFDPYARIELFAGLAAHFRVKVEFPAEAIDGITDEQYIRNVVDVAYRTRTDANIKAAAA